MSPFIPALKATYEKINSLYNDEFELDHEQKELAEINIMVNLTIAYQAIVQHKGLVPTLGDQTQIKELVNQLVQTTLDGTTFNTFKICSSKDEASKLFLELTKLGITIDPQEMENTECEKQAIVQGLYLIRSQKYISFILSAQGTLGIHGAIAMKIAQDSLAKEEAKVIYDKLSVITTLLVDSIQ